MALLTISLKCTPPNVLRAAMSTSVNQVKLEYFDGRMKDGWNPNGTFKCLHLVTPHRRRFILEELRHKSVIKQGSRPLDGLKILDVGCGPGLMTESMAAFGADVVGIDPAETAIQAARQHAETHSTSLLPRLHYHNSTAEEHVVNNIEQYDVVMACFILEYVADPEEFLKNCIKMLKINGSLFIQHINNSWINYLWFVIWQIRVNKLVPKEVATYSKLLSTNDIVTTLKSSGCRWVNSQGINANFKGDAFYVTKLTNCFNIIHMVKTGQQLF